MFRLPAVEKGSVAEVVLDHGLCKNPGSVVMPWDAEVDFPTIGAVGWALFLAAVR